MKRFAMRLRIGTSVALSAPTVTTPITGDSRCPRPRSPGGRLLSQALARMLLATALVGQARIEEACDLTHQTVDLTHGLGSAVVLDQLRHLALLLRSHAVRCPDVPQLLDRLRDTIRERRWVALPLPTG